MATSGDVIELIKKPDKLAVSERSARWMAQALRDGGLLEGRGAKHTGEALTTSGAVNWILASALGFRPANAAREVKDMCTREVSTVLYINDVKSTDAESNARHIAEYTRGLKFMFNAYFGDALDALVDDMRSGAFATWKATRPESTVTIEFNGADYIQIYLHSPQGRGAVVLGYGWVAAPKDRASVQRIVRLDGTIFEDLARVLGPPQQEESE
jgi:hypothetical protein